MPTPARSYAEVKVEARGRVIDFLQDIAAAPNSSMTTKVAAVRSLLQHPGLRAYAEPVLTDLETEGWVEVRGKLVYLVGKWKWSEAGAEAAPA